MIPHMNLEAQVDGDFSRARRRAFLKRIVARLRNNVISNQLLSFDEVRGALLASNQSYLGMRVVEVEKIVGSVGRQGDFDRSFLPARASVAARWKRIDRAFHGTEELPPVSLYKIEEYYFVLDGHHRVSVARYHHAETIDAEVIELRAQARMGYSQRGPEPEAPRVAGETRRRNRIAAIVADRGLIGERSGELSA
jgi:hypothetical protein